MSHASDPLLVVYLDVSFGVSFGVHLDADLDVNRSTLLVSDLYLDFGLDGSLCGPYSNLSFKSLITHVTCATTHIIRADEQCESHHEQAQ